MESATLQISQRGVITIPKSLRDTYGLADGDTLTLLDLGGVFVLAPVRTEIEALAGRVAAQLPFPIGSAGDFLAWYRGRLFAQVGT